MTRTTRRLLISVAALPLVVTTSCHVYEEALLGHDTAAVGGAGAGHFGGNTAAGGRGGFAGHSEADAGAADASVGGLDEVAGAFETGGTEASSGSGGTLSAGGSNGGIGGGIGGTSAGSSGIGGNVGGTGGIGGGAQTASGCAKLAVPLDETTDKAHFVISLASSVDLSAATISMRFYVQAGQGGTIFNYVQDSGTYHFLGVPADKRQALSSASGWTTITWNVGEEPDAAGTGIVKTSIKSIGVEINAQPSSTWSSPSTIVYVDSISVASPALSFTFDAASSVSTSNTNGVLWLNGNSSDTTATGCAVTWQATCP